MSKPVVNCGLRCISMVLGQYAEASESQTIFLTAGVPRCIVGTHTGSVVKRQPAGLETGVNVTRLACRICRLTPPGLITH